MELMRWDGKTRWLSKNTKENEFDTKYKKAVAEAKESVEKSTENYEAILLQEFAGDDVVADKKKALVSIEKANKILKIAEDELKKAEEYSSVNLRDNMTIDELADSWWQYRAEVRATQLAPIIERQRNALKEFYESLIEYEKFADKYEEDHKWASDLTRRIRGEKGYYSLGRITDGRDIIYPSDKELELARVQRRVPTRLLKGDE